MTKKIDQEIKGDSNTQQYIENQYIYQSDMTEEKVREISMASARIVASEYFAVSQDTANLRMKNFEDVVLNKFTKIENGLNAFNDPAFVYLYRKTQVQAAITDDEKNYNTLSELLIHRHNKQKDKYSQTGINGAIEIVNEISDSSLEALTILTCISYGIVPETDDLNNGLKTLDLLYSSILKDKLPYDNLWIDQLDVLKAVRLNSFSKFNKFDSIICNTLCKYIFVGIEKESDNYNKALEILKEYPITILCENPLCANHYVLPFLESKIDTLVKRGTYIESKLNENEKNALKEIFRLYDNKKEKIDVVRKNFMEKFDSYEHLKEIHVWWDSLEKSCDLTVIGRVLGHVNARNCYDEFPPLD